MTRRKPRANLRAGLWQDTIRGPIPADQLPPELAANPLSVACPWKPCKAPIRRTCTNHRGKARTPHPSRIEAANQALNPLNPSETTTQENP